MSKSGSGRSARGQNQQGASTPAQKSRSRRVSAGGLMISREEVQLLQDRLREAQDTLEAIRSGEVDAVVVHGARGHQIYSLSGAEQPYRVYVEHMQEGAVTVSTEGLILYCNQRFAEMIDQPLERAISSQITDHMPREAWSGLLGQLQESNTSNAAKRETTLFASDRAARPVHLTASRLPLEHQEVLCLVVTDLTEQREKAELRLAKELAEQASEAKDDFLARLSHELRTPLMPALLAATSLEEDGSLTEAVRHELNMIRRNVELEARLIDDLLDLTRVTRDKLQLHLAPVDVHVVIGRAIETCRADFVAKGQEVSLQLEAGRSLTHADAMRVQQVVWNLLRNAVKFTPDGGRIILRTANPSPDVLRLSVADNGIGFDPERAEHIFDAFEQGGREITHQFGGLGLGLAISRSIATAHGGTLRGESAGPQQGATFTLDLPIIASTAPAAGSAPAATPPRQGNRAHILLVEDHKDTRASMERLLRHHDYRVTSVDCAREALAAAAAQPFDVVISDLGLPDMSGIDLMRQLRDRHGLSGIAVSGYGMEEDVARSHAAGFSHHLTKPIRLDRLRIMIGELCRGAAPSGGGGGV